MDFDYDAAELLKMFGRSDTNSLSADRLDAEWTEIVDLVKSEPPWCFDESLLGPEREYTPAIPEPSPPLREPVSPASEPSAPLPPWRPSPEFITKLSAFSHTPKPRLPSSKEAKAKRRSSSLLQNSRSTNKRRPVKGVTLQPAHIPQNENPSQPVTVHGHTSEHRFTCVCPCLGYSITVHKIGRGPTCVNF